MNFFLLEDVEIDRNKLMKELNPPSITSFKQYLTMDKYKVIETARGFIPEKDLVRFDISTGVYSGEDLVDIVNMTDNYETKLFAISHLIQSYSSHSYLKCRKYINKYIELYNTKHNHLFYFELKNMCNSILYHSFTHTDKLTDKDIEELLYDKYDIITNPIGCSDEMIEERRNAFYIDMLTSLIEASKESNSPNSHIYFKYFYKYKLPNITELKCYDYCKTLYLYNMFLIKASSAASNYSFIDADESKELYNALIESIEFILKDDVNDIITMLTVYDKEEVANFLSIIKFCYDLGKARELKGIAKFNLSDEDEYFIKNELGGLLNKNDASSPSTSLYNTNANWIKFGTGYLRMIGG